MTRYFECTQCGKCCQGWRVPLSFDEAVAWCARGHGVEILLNAATYAQVPHAADSLAGYLSARAFTAPSGEGRLDIQATLVGAFRERCPNLTDDNRCGIYEVRPMTCRIYPAQVNPYLEFQPEQRKCPPEAWSETYPHALSDDGVVHEEDYVQLIERARRRAVEDVRYVQQICALLSITHCALRAEGLVIYQIPPQPFLRIAQMIRKAEAENEECPQFFYTVLSNQRPTVDALSAIGIACEFTPKGEVTLPADARATFLAFKENAA